MIFILDVKKQEMLLFDEEDTPIPLNLPEAEVIYYPNFIKAAVAYKIFDKLLNGVNWKQDTITVYGKNYLQPRLTCLFGNNHKPYSYSNILMYPEVFPEYLLEVKQQIEKLTQINFTSCLVNRYRNGADSNGWHADNEKELGTQPVIASLSLGATRWFHLKHKKKTNYKTKIALTHGSLLIMKGDTQKHWLHQIPKTKKEVAERINLTFRVVK